MEDLAVLRFVPQIGLENGLALKRRKIIFEQLPFTIEVIARRGRVTKSRHIPAGVFPETSFGIAMAGCFQWFYLWIALPAWPRCRWRDEMETPCRLRVDLRKCLLVA